jgi:DNA-binding MarR family transcriptional regulator
MEDTSKHLSNVKGPFAFHLSQEMGILMAEIARHLGVCTSAIAKAVKNLESVDSKC